MTSLEAFSPPIIGWTECVITGMIDAKNELLSSLFLFSNRNEFVDRWFFRKRELLFQLKVLKNEFYQLNFFSRWNFNNFPLKKCRKKNIPFFSSCKWINLWFRTITMCQRIYHSLNMLLAIESVGKKTRWKNAAKNSQKKKKKHKIGKNSVPALNVAHFIR